MNPPTELLFDIETLVNSAQPRRILLLGDVDPAFLNEYSAQKKLLSQEVEVTHLATDQIDELWSLDARFDVGLVLNLLEHLDKTRGQQVLSRLRDVLAPQYCVALPIDQRSQGWQLTDLFSFALSIVNSYTLDMSDAMANADGSDTGDTSAALTLFKYNIEDYKKTPDWLNADNWANPQLWGKYWW